MKSPIRALRRTWVRQAVSQGLSMLDSFGFVREKVNSTWKNRERPNLETEFSAFCDELQEYYNLMSLKRRIDMCDEMDSIEMYSALGFRREDDQPHSARLYGKIRDNEADKRMKRAIEAMGQFCIPPPRRYANHGLETN